MKKRILSILLVAAAILTIGIHATPVMAGEGSSANASEYSINAKKDIPDIFSIN